MGGGDDRAACAAVVLHQFPKLLERGGIESVRRLIQQPQRRPRGGDPRKRCSPGLSGGKQPDGNIGHGFKAQRGES